MAFCVIPHQQKTSIDESQYPTAEGQEKKSFQQKKEIELTAKIRMNMALKAAAAADENIKGDNSSVFKSTRNSTRNFSRYVHSTRNNYVLTSKFKRSRNYLFIGLINSSRNLSRNFEHGPCRCVFNLTMLSAL
ncbi:hypothetical protein DPMN_151392 [Dreissena polymorpha]|uniref:Uncharacterized protein n=1 Tax=Dreissena polymorpha TaxID=45954 RepID=A0A9D4FJV8_DREPO|nr:hypothetical protein DPMN_151392 [Dreissena polymorpha]